MDKVCILLVLITYGNGGTAPLIFNLGMRRCQQSTAYPSHFNPCQKKKKPPKGTQWIAERVYPRARQKNGCTPGPDSRTGVPQGQSACCAQDIDLSLLLGIELWFLRYTAHTPVIILIRELWLILCTFMWIWIFLHRWYFSNNKWWQCVAKTNGDVYHVWCVNMMLQITCL